MPRKREPAPTDRELRRQLTHFAKSLRRLRERAGLSQQGLASGAGLSMTTVYELESGRIADVRLGTVLALARTLAVGVGDLIDLSLTEGREISDASRVKKPLRVE